MEFLKILWDNLKKGPVTDAFPSEKRIPRTACAGGSKSTRRCAWAAARASTSAPPEPSTSRNSRTAAASRITVWRNSCCLCAQCRHYCPTKAVTLTNDWHSAHRATEKYTQITRAKVKYDYCAVCGAKMRVLPQEVLNRIYAKHSEVDVDVISHLCPNCRRIDVAVEEDRACHIDQLERWPPARKSVSFRRERPKRPSADKENQRKLPLRRPLPRKQPHPRGKLRLSPSPTLRLPRRHQAPRRLG